VAQALAGDTPLIVVSRHSGRTGQDEQEGLRFLLMGAMQGLRNPGGHELTSLEMAEAAERLAFASLLMRWLDSSRKTEAAQLGGAPNRPRKPRTRGQGDGPKSRASADSLRLAVLAELSDMSHRQARTSAILDLRLGALAERTGIPQDALQDTLVDLLAEGLAEPYAATMDQSAEQGACRITGEGSRELSRLRSELG
jgi:hypothetical protein